MTDKRMHPPKAQPNVFKFFDHQRPVIPLDYKCAAELTDNYAELNHVQKHHVLSVIYSLECRVSSGEHIYEHGQLTLAIMLIILNKYEGLRKGFDLLLQTTVFGERDKQDADANFFLAFCIQKAKEINFNPAKAVELSHEKSKSVKVQLAYLMLRNDAFLELLRQKYDNPNRIDIVNQLLKAYRKDFHEAVLENTKVAAPRPKGISF